MGLTKTDQALLQQHLDCMLQANKIHNLTSITNLDEAKIMHLEDSLEALQEINSIGKGELVDLGSGGGFPGIPLAIATKRQTTLVETVRKKADCLNSFISELNINDYVFVSNCRIEEIAVEKPNYYKIATARALSSISSLLELASPLLQINGYLVCYKGDNVGEELKDSNNIEDKLGFVLESNRSYTLRNSVEHRIIIYKKIKNAELKLPRKLGFAQKHPLK